MKNTVQKVLKWVVMSSANPDEVSMTIQGIALLAGAHAIDNLSAIGINLSQATYAHDVAIAAGVLGVILTAVGAARKIILTSQTSSTTSSSTLG